MENSSTLSQVSTTPGLYHRVSMAHSDYGVTHFSQFETDCKFERLGDIGKSFQID